MSGANWRAGFAAELFDEIAGFSADVAGVSRPALSTRETQALATLSQAARDEGLAVETDRAGNAWFAHPEEAGACDYVIVGSHVDSVPQGGNYDGLAGVMAGLLCLVGARRRDARPPVAVRALALRAEESPWFGAPYLGSKALLGRLSAAEFAAPHRRDGRPMSAHLTDIGADAAAIGRGEALAEIGRMRAYVELHLEQGPLLIEKGLPAAVVSGIRGNIRYPEIAVIGAPGHSGAVPRAYRRDAVLAMADYLARLDESWTTILQKGDDLVLTSGMVWTDPARHAMTRIPEEVRFSLEARSQSAQTLRDMRALLAEEAARVGAERRVRFDFCDEIYSPPALCAPGVVEGLTEAQAQAGQTPFVMASGAGHDAAVFAAAGVPSGMVFVRNQGGSHNPAETMEMADFLKGVDVIDRYLALGAPV